MPNTAATRSDLAARLCATVLERFPFALPLVRKALGSADPTKRDAFRAELLRIVRDVEVRDIPDPTPRVTASQRLQQAHSDLVETCDAFLRREEIARSLTPDERREILRGMILTRAVDNRLKHLFTSGEVTFRDAPFQGKGFRSLGQEAIYAAAIRLRRGPSSRDGDHAWRGDIVGPIIRDLGVALAMRPEGETVRM